MPPAAGVPTQLGHVALRVSDLDQSIGFYRDVIGMTLRGQFEDKVAFLGIRPDASHEIALFQLEDRSSPPPDSIRAGMYHMAWEMPSFEDLQQFHERLVAHDVRIVGYSDRQSNVMFLDPDGNELEAIWEPSLAELERRKAAGMEELPTQTLALTDTAATELVRTLTRITRPALVPELRVRVADAVMPTWEATERHVGHAVPPPFWAFLWPGSQVLARLLLDRPELVRDRRVFDFGSGCGLAAIAAAQCGASRVVACDIDPLAAESQYANALLNDVRIESVVCDPTRRHLDEVDVVLAGDVCYERSTARQVTGWLCMLADDGLEVLLADPGRAYAPHDQGLEELASYEVPTTRELETSDILHTVIWRITSKRSVVSD